ncbi:class I SAM-dependent methyltransferase [Aliishimia ponticola]|uniref:Class I SAM-dependent methyltransferase n=1 Tax=Aliishimia ponticola TaxID=2499833 RepID=A0A4S4NFE0_9RHOB|nr:class I SAM-dependent methyltransferase [Aliishimia ponticola]THH36858.1 class I SAM-dependent methyltransferase [Aliishimia ponticola]
MSTRLTLAAQAGAIVDGSDGHVLLFCAPDTLDISVFGTMRITVVQDMMPAAANWAARGVTTVSRAEEDADLAVVFLPRAKQAARDVIARAAQRAGRVLVDGQKTDGVDALLKEVRARTEILGTVAKAHGKLFWFDAASFEDWIAAPGLIDGRWHVVPGVFSADGVDPGSALLAAHVPAALSGRVADLGAGWGYLSAHILDACPKITELHLVEAQGAALDCARQNVTDARARFHWADATTWAGETAFDAVVMNPPFHTGRAAEPDLGRAFIASAARLLRPGGTLWMVANRHLPYEQALRDSFAEFAEIGGTNKFKIVKALAKPRARR